jgi:hypothetical protein
VALLLEAAKYAWRVYCLTSGAGAAFTGFDSTMWLPLRKEIVE